MMINDTQSIGCVTLKDGYPYLGFKFIPTNNLTKIIERNVNDKMYNVSKYYGWLEINETIPIEVKLRVIVACLTRCCMFRNLG